jgi:hypothetical protein
MQADSLDLINSGDFVTEYEKNLSNDSGDFVTEYEKNLSNEAGSHGKKRKIDT